MREGERNIGFFHRMTNSRIRKNSLARIKIDGVWFSEEEEMRAGVTSSFQTLFD